MARPEISVFRLFLLITIEFLAASHQMFDPNSMMALCFSSRRNQTGHINSKWSMSNGASKLSSNLKICMNSNFKEERGMRVHELSAEVTVPPPRSPSYELFPGVGYYKLYPEGVPTYYQASSTCMNEGGHLAIIDSAAELEVIKMLYARYPNAKGWAYIGFNDIAEEGKYVTIFAGKPLVMNAYLKWSPGQPDNGDGNEDCGSINRDGLLNDLWCDKKGPWSFICEYDLSWEL